MAAREAGGRLDTVLSRSRMDSDQVRELVDIVDALGRDRPVRVFPKGIPYPDLLHWETIVRLDELDVIKGLLETGRLEQLEIFPYGIVAPELLGIRAELR